MKFIDKIVEIVLFGLIGFIIVLAGIIYVPGIIGLQEYEVVTGSMEPELPVGSLIFVKSIDYHQLEKGDIIAFSRLGENVVTHRVVNNDQNQQTVTTKGDANEKADLFPVEYKDIKGKMILSIPVLGYILSWFSHLFSKMIIIGVIIILIIIQGFLDKKKKLK